MTAPQNPSGTKPDCDPNCLHCAISKHLVERRRLNINFQNICEVGQVVADMIASIEDPISRAQWGHDTKRAINKMLDEVIAGEWHAFQGGAETKGRA